MLARPERAPRTAPRQSDRARRRLSFQWERFSALGGELSPLFIAHWKEIALNQDSIPLDPDYAKYLQCELLGVLHVLTARDADTGRLVGYVFCMIGPSLHYASTCWCMVDMYWLDGAYRVGWNGVRMLKAFEAGAAARGAKIVMAHEKLHFADTHRHGHNAGALWEFLGYNPIETVFSKRIG